MNSMVSPSPQPSPAGRGSIVVARMTAIRSNNNKLIIEVYADATYSSFYHFHSQEGNRRSTKTQVRVANRNAGLPRVNVHLYEPGLEVLRTELLGADKIDSAFVSVKVRIIKKRLYKKLITCAPDVLGMAKAGTVEDKIQSSRGIPVYLPVGYVNPVRQRELAKIGVR